MNKQVFTIAIAYAVAMNETSKTLAANLRRLMEHHGHSQTVVAQKSGVSQKSVSNLLNPGDDKSPTLETVNSIAKAYKIKVWHLLLDNCPDDILFNHSIEKLVENFNGSDKRGRDSVMQVSETTAAYSQIMLAPQKQVK